MNGIKIDPFFQASKKIKAERIKWFTIIIITNLIIFFTTLSKTPHNLKASHPWPDSWVAVSITADVLASGPPPVAVTILDTRGYSIFNRAYLLDENQDCQQINGAPNNIRIMIAAQDISKLKKEGRYKVLPFSQELVRARTQAPRINYEIHF